MYIQGNALPNYDNRCLTSFVQAEAIVDQFEKDLASLGISVANGSDLEIVCLNIMDLEAKRQGRSNIDLRDDCRPQWRRTVGLIDLLRLLKCVRAIGKLSLFEAHLRLLNQGVAPQNVRALSDDACNKIFEMLVALFCLPLAETLELDDPYKSQGKNPDVLAKIDGTIWGFACKTPNGTSAKTMFERMREGVEQIEASPAQRGAVYFNFRNVIDHEQTWPAIPQESGSAEHSRFIFRIWPNAEPVEVYLRSLVDEKNAEMLREIGPQHVQKLFVDKKSIPGAMVFLQTAAAVQSSDGPFVATIGIPAVMKFGSVAATEMQLLQRIQCARRGAYGL
jgi:hypothetical protein